MSQSSARHTILGKIIAFLLSVKTSQLGWSNRFSTKPPHAVLFNPFELSFPSPLQLVQCIQFESL